MIKHDSFSNIKLFCKRKVCGIVLFLICALLSPQSTHAQINEWLYQSDPTIVPEQKGELRFELDNLSFFKNNEFEGNSQKGYTLPGVWLQPKLVYFPLRNMKLELGLNLLRYWGTSYYPEGGYIGIPIWNNEKVNRGLGHILPFFRFNVQLYDHVHVVLGNLYGGTNHDLNQALYNAEYNLTADPESGIQVLIDYRNFSLDGWVDWQDFIYNGDERQEKFVAGISSKIKLIKPEAKFQLNIPLQAIFRHQGGEIDDAEGSVKTWLNGGAGLEMSYDIKKRFFRKVSLSMMGLYSSQQAGEVLPLGKGLAVNATMAVEVKDFKLSVGYWEGDKFFSIMGNPFFSCLSARDDSYVFDKPSMIYGGLEYIRKFGKGFAFGTDLSVYYRSACDYSGLSPMGEEQAPVAFTTREKSALSWSLGIYLRINPSVLLWRFK